MSFSIKSTIVLIVSFVFIFKCSSQEVQGENLSEEPTYYSLRKALRNKDAVKRLDLSNQELAVFPMEIFELKNLAVLFIDSNQIEIIPSEIRTLKELVVFGASYNDISKLPPEIEKLFYKLQYLDLNNNRLEQIQPELCRLSSLLTLNLSQNKIKVIPADIRQLGTLQNLSIANNQIAEIPEEFKGLYSLQTLNLSNNLLPKLPSEIFELKQLKKLYVYNNAISSIHKSVNNLKELEILSLSKNKISTLSPTFFELFKLKKLYLDSNQILNLPIGISRMLGLEILDVSDNPFTTIPKEYNRLKYLKKIYLENNKLNAFPQVLYDLQNNKTKVEGITTKELYSIRLLFSKARNKRLIKEFDNSILRYEEILKRDTNNTQAMVELTSTYLDISMYDLALKICERALTKDPSLTQLKELKVLHNYCKNKTSNDSEILTSYKNKIESSDSKTAPYFDLGLYYFDKEKYNQAITQFEEAIRRNPNNNDAHFYYAVTSKVLDKQEAFNFSVLRFLIMTESDTRTKTILPYLMTDFNMKTGTLTKKNGVESTVYLDTYVIKNNKGEIIYRSKNPTSELLNIMLLDILNSEENKNSSNKKKKINEELEAVLDEITNESSSKNNVEVLTSQLNKLCEDIDGKLDKDSFYYKYYHPYFNEMIDKGYLQVFSYLINKKREEKTYIKNWLKDNATLIEEFIEWSKQYQFNKQN